MSVKIVSLADADPSDDYEEEKHVYTAKVLNTFRGEIQTHIHYSMVVEKGEATSLANSPIIITLCKDTKEYYWPGVGSIFPANKQIKEIASQKKGSLNNKQTQFTDCD